MVELFKVKEKEMCLKELTAKAKATNEWKDSDNHFRCQASGAKKTQPMHYERKVKQINKKKSVEP